MLTSKVAVPRASLVVVAATCGMFDIPIEGIALIPIDHFAICLKCNECFGNALATSVVGQWEENNEIDIVSLD
jgi:Na+/H+-dicarboxylate symporter